MCNVHRLFFICKIYLNYKTLCKEHNAISQIARHRRGGWATGGPAVAATGALVAHPRCAIWDVTCFTNYKVYY